MPPSGRVLDVGCGNGRNSHYMKSLGYSVTSIDMVGDFGTSIVLGHDKLPAGKFDIILANYVLMFLNKKEQTKLLRQIEKCASAGCVFVVEMYPAKDAFPYNFDAMVEKLLKNWQKLRKSKERCVLRKR